MYYYAFYYHEIVVMSIIKLCIFHDCYFFLILILQSYIFPYKELLNWNLKKCQQANMFVCFSLVVFMWITHESSKLNLLPATIGPTTLLLFLYIVVLRIQRLCENDLLLFAELLKQ